MKNTDVSLVGHAHIDAVWLWDHAETKEVLNNTFGRILDLMDEYKDITFIQTSAQYYLWMEQENSELYKRIKRYVDEGRWEVTGGMWVEPDCNMPDGESLCRQILYGQKYFEQKFGKKCRICWLPDVFGFGWTLPSILKEGGMDYFFTSKLIWQTRLPFPENAFEWKGPDGASVIGYQTPGLYNNLDVYGVYKQSIKFKTRTGYGFFLAPFGEGDHGGGLSKELVEMVHNQVHAMNCVFGNAEEYFVKLEKELKNLPVINDELYLNTHRGTLTTQSNMKAYNKFFEKLLNATEKLEALSAAKGNERTSKALLEDWYCLLLNQFHDALPGSSIKKVYEDADVDFAAMRKSVESIMFSDLESLTADLDTSWATNPMAVFNPLTWTVDREYEIEAPADSAFYDKDIRLQAQYEGNNKYKVYIPDMKPLSFVVIDIREDVSKNKSNIDVSEDMSVYVLKNKYYIAKISKLTGRLESFIGANGIDIAGERGLGSLELYEDFTTSESAWNICKGRYYNLEYMNDAQIVEIGQLYATVCSSYRYIDEAGDTSTFKMYYTIHQYSPILEIKADIDWHAKYVTCQAIFDYKSAKDVSRFQIAYGTIDRMDSHSKDANPYIRERWEVSGHGWVCTENAEGTVGQVVFSDAKYGYGQEGNAMHLTLLRSPIYPNPAVMGLTPREDGHTDQGRHILRYGIASFGSCTSMMELHRLAAEFTAMDIVLAMKTGQIGKASESGLIAGHTDGIYINTIKLAEDDNGYVVRLFETEGTSGKKTIEFTREIADACEMNILEEKKDVKVEMESNKITFDVGHNSIKTLKVTFK